MLSVMKCLVLLMVWIYLSKPELPEIMPSRCPVSWRMVVRRSYLPAALPVVAR